MMIVHCEHYVPILVCLTFCHIADVVVEDLILSLLDGTDSFLVVEVAAAQTTMMASHYDLE